ITGEVDAARRAHEESRRLADESADHQGSARALWQLGIVASIQGRESDAERLQRDSLAISRQHGFTLIMASALDNLGILAFKNSDYTLAQSYWQESHGLFRELGFDIGLTTSLLHHAALASLANVEKARALCAEALTKAKETGHKGNVAYALVVLGQLYTKSDPPYAKSDRRLSRALYEEAIAVARDVGNKQSVALALSCMGLVSLDEGKFAEADRLLKESFALLVQLHEDQSVDAATCSEHLGWVAFEQGRFQEARELSERGQSIASFRTEKWHLLRLSGFAHLALVSWIRDF
ncbi:MAG TPA: tetratricopeptide repeat protein, partial [Gemmatimonadaceae bacterium]|nr:tetratricopeptide repeat protein [Gemmatimonadaceae bacterium]